jgi:hypothetical protein
MAQPGVRVVARGAEVGKALGALRASYGLKGKDVPGIGTITPGTVWEGRKMVAAVTGMSVYATVDDTLYEYNFADFVREANFQAVTKAAKGAKGWCVLAEMEMNVICALAGPAYIVLAVEAAKLALFVYVNKREVSDAMENAPRAMTLLLYIRRKYPTLFGKLVLGSARTVLVGLKEEVVSAERIAEFIADLLKDLGKGEGAVTVRLLAEVLKKVTISMMATKGLAKMMGASAVKAAGRRSEELRDHLNRMGCRVSLGEAKAISAEVSTDPAAATKLQDLQSALNGIVPFLQKLGEEKDEAAKPGEGAEARAEGAA